MMMVLLVSFDMGFYQRLSKAPYQQMPNELNQPETDKKIHDGILVKPAETLSPGCWMTYPSEKSWTESQSG